MSYLTFKIKVPVLKRDVFTVLANVNQQIASETQEDVKEDILLHLSNELKLNRFPVLTNIKISNVLSALFTDEMLRNEDFNSLRQFIFKNMPYTKSSLLLNNGVRCFLLASSKPQGRELGYALARSANKHLMNLNKHFIQEDIDFFEHEAAASTLTEYLMEHQSKNGSDLYYSLLDAGITSPLTSPAVLDASCDLFDKLAIRHGFFIAINKIIKLIGSVPDAPGLYGAEIMDYALHSNEERRFIFDESSLPHMAMLKEIISLFGDPRVSTAGITEWSAMDESSINIVKKWLNKTSINLFFNIISESAEGVALKQWNERKKYWMQAFNDNYITDAWFALGDESQIVAGKINEVTINVDYGIVTSSRKGLDILIMRLTNGAVVVEGSNNFAMRVFTSGFESGYKGKEVQIPEFYSARYHNITKMLPNIKSSNFYKLISHHANGSWKMEMNRYLGSY